MRDDCRRAAFLITFDSYLRGALPLARILAEAGIKGDFYMLTQGKPGDADRKLPFPSDVKYETLSEDDLSALLQEKGYDAVVIGAGGNRLIHLLKIIHTTSFAKVPAGRPVTITLFPGLTLYRQERGFAARLSSDLILFNSRKNLRDYGAFCRKIDADARGGTVSGFLSCSDAPVYSPVFPPKNILYVNQSVVPDKLTGRQNVARNLIKCAERRPESILSVLCRDSGCSASAHPEDYSMPELLRRAALDIGRPLPFNLIITAEPVATLLGKTDFCFGIASTVLAEAMLSGIPVGILNDFGFPEEFGNKLFKGSNCLFSFADMINNKLPSAPDPDWRADNIIRPDKDRIAEKILALCAMRDRSALKILNPYRIPRIRTSLERKWLKFRNDPVRFLTDSRFSLFRMWGGFLRIFIG